MWCFGDVLGILFSFVTVSSTNAVHFSQLPHFSSICLFLPVFVLLNGNFFDYPPILLIFAMLQEVSSFKNYSFLAGHHWLTPIILATWEAESQRNAVQGQPGQIVRKSHLQNFQSKMGWRCGLRGRAPAFKCEALSKPDTAKKIYSFFLKIASCSC
jgi:hypothetical protein